MRMIVKQNQPELCVRFNLLTFLCIGRSLDDYVTVRYKTGRGNHLHLFLLHPFLCFPRVGSNELDFNTPSAILQPERQHPTVTRRNRNSSTTTQMPAILDDTLL